MLDGTCRLGVLAAALALFTPLLVSAQTTTGRIEGVIRDSSGGVLPGVQVTANSPSLIQKNLTVHANEEGFYRLPLLPPGTYEVTYNLDGFQTLARAGLLVTAGQATVVNTQLSVATLDETVTVVGESPMVDPTAAEVVFTYNSSVIQTLPTGRTLQGLMATIPGVEQGTSGFEETAQNVLGAGIRANVYTLDQGNATDPRIQSNMAGFLPYDIVEEVQVMKGGKPAEVGFAFGGFTQVVTKSGGNDFHGAADIRHQGESLQSNNLTDRLREAGVRRSNRVIGATDSSVTAGWRFVRDKLWWFGAVRDQSSETELFGFPENKRRDTKGYFWKNTYQPHSQHRLTGGLTYWTDNADLESSGGAVQAALADDREALRLKDWSGAVVAPRWTGVLTDTVIAEAGGTWSRFEIHGPEEPTAGIRIFDLVTGRAARNPGGVGTRINPSFNYEGSGSISWFLPQAAGRHELKFGGGYTRARIPGHFTQVGDHELRLNNGVPAQVQIQNTPVDVELDEDLVALYVQDKWTIRNKLTLNLGVRYDRVHAFTQDSQQGGGNFAGTALAERFPFLDPIVVPGRHILTFNSVAPRLSAAWSIDAHTTLKGSYARYYHFMQSQFLPGVGVPEVTRMIFDWNDRNENRAYEVGEEGSLLQTIGGFAAGTQVDPDLEHPYSDEIVVGFSRELATDLSFSVNVNYRQDNRMTNFVDIGVPFTSFQPVNVVDPGDDGRVGTGDDATLSVFAQDRATLGQNRRLMTNPDGNVRTYKGVELVASKRLAQNWQFVGSFVGSRMEVISPALDTGQSDWFANPNARLNAAGLDPDNVPYQFKLQGTYLAPYGVVLSAFYRLTSGLPITRQLVVRGLPQGTTTVFAEPRGSRRLDRGQKLDVQVEKTFDLAGRTRLGLVLEAFNLTNAATVLSMGTSTGVNLGRPLQIENPRIARLGVRFVW